MRLLNPIVQLIVFCSQLFVSEETGEKKELARSTFRQLILSYALDGAYYGLFVSYANYVLKTAIEKEQLVTIINKDMLITLAAMCGIIGLLFSYNFVYYFQGKSKKPLFYTASFLALISATAFHYISPGFLFLPFIALASLGDAIKLPGRNAILQSNFSERERSRFLGNLMLFSSIAGIGGVLIGGKILNANYQLFEFLFPAALLLPAVSSLVLSRIKAIPLGLASTRKFRLLEILKPYKNLLSILRVDRHFLVFEIGFFLYGGAFMIVNAMYPIFYYDTFKALPSQFGFTVIITNIVMMFAPFIGKMADKSNPIKISALAFLALAFFPIFLLFTNELFQGYAAHVWYALAMVGVLLSWNLGPIFFSGGKDSASYVGIHATLTGLRAIIVFPIAGYIKENSESYIPVFALAAGLLFSAAIVMFFLNRHAKKSPRFRSTLSGRFQTVD